MSDDSSLSNNKNINVDLSLIIDDSKTAKVTIDLNNADENYINSLCEELSNKFSLDEQVKNKVQIQLQNMINKLKKMNNSKKNIEETFNRLYYIDIEKRKKNFEKNINSKKEKQQKELENYTFKPLINDYSQKLGKNNKNVEERLYPSKNKKFVKEFLNYKQKLKKKLELNNENKKNNPKDLSPKTNLYINEKSPSKNINENYNNNNTNNNINTSLNIKKAETEKIDIKLENESFKIKSNKKKKKTQNIKSATSFVKIFEKIQSRKNYVKDLTEISSISGSGKKPDEKINMTNSAFYYTKPFKIGRLNFTKDKSNKIKNLSIETDVQNYDNRNYKRTISNIQNKEVAKDKDNIIFGLNISSDTDKLLIVPSKDSIKKEKNNNIKNINNYNQELTYQPKISEISKKIMSKRKESKKEFLNRISTTKYLTETNEFMKKLQEKKNENKNNRFHTINNINNNSNKININNHIRPKSNRIKEKKQNEIILNKINEINKIKQLNNNIYLKNSYQEIENFKYKQFKNCYEILTMNNEINYDSLTENGITDTLKNKVIIPACIMISKKHLEFNFHNFYIICKEILDNYLS